MNADGPRDQSSEFDFGPGPEDLSRTREFDFGPDAAGRPPRGRSGRNASKSGRSAANRGRNAAKPGRSTLDDAPEQDTPGPRRRRVATTPAHRPSQARDRRPAWQRLLLGAAVALAVVVLAAGAMRVAYAGKALPGTTVAGQDVGGKTEDEVRAAVERAANPERRITLTAPGRTLRVSAAGSGLQADVDATVDRAMASRRSTFFTPLVALATGGDIPLVATVDSEQLQSSVNRVATAVDRKPYAGALIIDPETLAVTTKPSEAGREVQRQELSAALTDALVEPSIRPVTIPVETTQAVSDEDVESIAREAKRYLARPLRLTGAGKPYVVEPSTLAALLALEPLDDGQDARLGVDSAELSRLTKRVADARDRAAKSASISAPARGPVLDGKGEVEWRPKSADVTVVRDGRSGLAVKVKDLNGRVRAAVRDGKHEAKVPTTTTAAPVSRAAASKINRVIGTFTTAYVAGQPRVTNIQRMARSIDRTVIAPGQTFSLNGIAGERTKAKGYVEAPFIAENKIEPSVGGGVSQFSTTMYNAAYFAGLQIDAFRPHSLFIDRYPPGRESTLNFPDIDMKWTNDTKVPILVRTYADGAGVTVTLYGNNGGRRVEALPGDREPNPGGNFAITVTRVIHYPGGKEARQPVTTRYANEVTDDAPQE